MCTIELEATTLFVYLASWTVIVSHVICLQKRIMMPLVCILCVAGVLMFQLESTCSVAFVKWGAATESVLLFVLFINIARHE